MGLPMQVVALDANGGYDTHDNQAATLPDDLGAASRSRWPPSRPTSRRAASPTACCQRLERVRAPPGGERQRHRPRRRRPLAADRHAAKGTMVGEFPGLATLDEDDNLRHTTDFRAVYCSLLEQWLGVDAAGIIPGASGFARPALVR